MDTYSIVITAACNKNEYMFYKMKSFSSMLLLFHFADEKL